jgi:hypothetical protein
MKIDGVLTKKNKNTIQSKTMQAAWYEQLGSAQDVIRYGQIEVPSFGASEEKG